VDAVNIIKRNDRAMAHVETAWSAFTVMGMSTACPCFSSRPRPCPPLLQSWGLSLKLGCLNANNQCATFDRNLWSLSLQVMYMYIFVVVVQPGFSFFHGLATSPNDRFSLKLGRMNANDHYALLLTEQKSWVLAGQSSECAFSIYVVVVQPGYRLQLLSQS